MIRALWLVALTALATPVAAQDSVVIYRCTDTSGAISVQNDVPCPKGSQQQRRVIEIAQPGPAGSPRAVSTPATPLVSAAVPAPTPAEPQLIDDMRDPIPAEPPPALFSCRAWDRTEHFSDDPVPVRRCAPLRVSGLDGSAGSANASACQYVTDSCAPVPADALCKQWRQHAQDTRAKLLFGRAEDPAATRIELERIEAIVQASTCKGDG